MPRDQAFYEIKIEGHLDSHWSEWFDGLTITYEERGETILSGPVPDQAALHGLLNKIRDLGLALLAVNLVERPCSSGSYAERGFCAKI